MLIDNFSENFLSKMWGGGFTQKELCEKLNVSRSALWNLFHGNTVLVAPIAIKAAAALGYDLELRLVRMEREDQSLYKAGTIGEKMKRAKTAAKRREAALSRPNDGAMLSIAGRRFDKMYEEELGLGEKH